MNPIGLKKNYLRYEDWFWSLAGEIGKAVRGAASVLFVPGVGWVMGALCISPSCTSSEAVGCNWSS